MQFFFTYILSAESITINFKGDSIISINMSDYSGDYNYLTLLSKKKVELHCIAAEKVENYVNYNWLALN